jgi:hypothetical protein
VDLDGDGIGDLLTGSWPGELYFFKGKGKGEFEPAVQLQQQGKPINLGRASTVFAADWRGTGRLDLLVGNIGGEVILLPNNGSRSQPRYGPPQKLQAGGQPIKAPHGDSQPVVVDWDQDGLLDLIVGCGDGSVVWYRNLGSKNELRLGQGTTLVKPGTLIHDDKSTIPVTPGIRAKVSVVDWNGDGRLDLLLGDFGILQGEKPKLSEADQKTKKEAEQKLADLQKKLLPHFEKYQRKAQEGAKPDDSEEIVRARQAKAQEVLQIKEVVKLLSDQREILEAMSKFQAPTTYRGNVWLYLRQGADLAQKKDNR